MYQDDSPQCGLSTNGGQLRAHTQLDLLDDLTAREHVAAQRIAHGVADMVAVVDERQKEKQWLVQGRFAADEALARQLQ